MQCAFTLELSWCGQRNITVSGAPTVMKRVSSERVTIYQTHLELICLFSFWPSQLRLKASRLFLFTNLIYWIKIHWKKKKQLVPSKSAQKQLAATPSCLVCVLIWNKYWTGLFQKMREALEACGRNGKHRPPCYQTPSSCFPPHYTNFNCSCNSISMWKMSAGWRWRHNRLAVDTLTRHFWDLING